MIINRAYNKVELKDLLKADPFSKELQIKYEDKDKFVPVMSKKDFFEQVYTEVIRKKITVADGARSELRRINMTEWEEEIRHANNSLVIFIEGYAGCGKSVFVQQLLQKYLGLDKYEYIYYNYDIAAYPKNELEKRDRNFHILPSVREAFIHRMAYFSLSKPNVIEKFKKIVRQKEIEYIDGTGKILEEFSNSKAIWKAEKQLKRTRKESDFRNAVTSQIRQLSCEHILALDYMLRLAIHIVEKDNEAIYVCYDNLDVIENIEELAEFNSTLISLRRNIDMYIKNASENYKEFSETPRFVIFSTYRKITAARTELNIPSEGCGDYADEYEFIQYIDVSRFYQYQQIISRRKDFFAPFIESKKISGRKLEENFGYIEKLSKMHFIKVKYAGLWNNNYRNCGNILNEILVYYSDDIKKCIELLDNKTDGFDEIHPAYYGASAVFLYAVCKLFRRRGIWGKNMMDLVPLQRVEENPEPQCSKLTSLSRLILTYIHNRTESLAEQNSVSTKEIFEEFDGLFTGDEICECLKNMLARDMTGTWRRPLYYSKNAIPSDSDVEESLATQWAAYKSGDGKVTRHFYTEFMMCECGSAYINLVIPEFECFAVRVGNDKSLYMTEEPDEMEHLIENVLKAVEDCCNNMSTFSKIYMDKKGIKSYDMYVERRIHPRTKKKNPQLNTERYIFTHISYLNRYRLCYVKNFLNPDVRKEANIRVLNAIKRYLSLYTKYIVEKNPIRKKVSDQLLQKADIAINAENEENSFLSIEC